MLVKALRAMAIGRADCPGLVQAFNDACGPMGTPALHAYFILVKCIGMSSRRRLKVHLPGCPELSFDEGAIVAVVAAAQESVRNADQTMLKMRLRFLVEGEPCQKTLFAAHAVAQVFEASGRDLPQHTTRSFCRARAAGEDAELRVIH